jgi:alpha-L-rhamnosidase
VLRCEFTLDSPPADARLIVACLGDYRVDINGKRLIDAPRSPIWSDYSRVVYEQTFDVTAVLQQGGNALGILLGDGLYSGSVPGLGRNVYGIRPVVAAQLHITDAEGRDTIVLTDHHWHWHTSWLLAAETNEGEHVDGRQRASQWSEPDLDELHWSTVDVVDGLDVQRRAQGFALDTVQQVLRPQNLPFQPPGDGRVVVEYDFGSQIVGRCRIHLRSGESDSLEITYSLDDRFEAATLDTYTSRGDVATERFETEFGLHSFRFVRVEFSAGVTQIEEIFALRIGGSDLSTMGFRCDHPSINQLFEVTQNSLRGVAQFVPWRGLDPQERLPDMGYLGTWLDSFVRQGNYAVPKKWLTDLRDALAEPEADADCAPPLPRALPEGDVFASFVTLVAGAWALYRFFDDRSFLQSCYPTLRSMALDYRYRYPALIRDEYRSDLYGEGYSGTLVAACVMYTSLKVCGRVAGVLARLSDYEMLEELAGEVRKAVRTRFLTRDGRVAVDSQSAYVAALQHGVLEPDERALAETRLVELVQASNYHTDVVPAAVHALLPVLTRAGRLDVAYMVLLQTSEPSWLANVNAGMQLIAREPEHFDIGQVGILQWLTEVMIGLTLDDDYSGEANGYRSVQIRPNPPLGHLFAAGSPIQLVEASLDTINGRYEVSWQIKDDAFELELVVPPSCRAVVTLPDDIKQEVQSGSHRFVMGFDAGGDGIPILLETAGGPR